MHVLIVDDEQPARDKMRRMLAEQNIGAVSEAVDGYQALEMVAAEQPDVLFLDIQMPEITGLEVAASLPQPAPLVVFVTAYDQYAIRAFDANAIDYLLKPYDQERLTRALQRVRERLRTRKSSADSADSSSLGADNPDKLSAVLLPPVKQLLISERGVTRVIRTDHIEWLETADNYVVLHMADGQPLMRQTLTALLEKLGSAFVRCHRRAAIRCDAVESLIALEKGDGELRMRSGAVVPCSRQYRAAVVAAIG
jgi:two-component system LytT family response regulator